MHAPTPHLWTTLQTTRLAEKATTVSSFLPTMSEFSYSCTLSWATISSLCFAAALVPSALSVSCSCHWSWNIGMTTYARGTSPVPTPLTKAHCQGYRMVLNFAVWKSLELTSLEFADIYLMQLVSCLCVHCVPLRFWITPVTHLPWRIASLCCIQMQKMKTRTLTDCLLHTLASNVRFHFTYRCCPLCASFTLLTLIWLKNCFFHDFPPIPQPPSASPRKTPQPGTTEQSLKFCPPTFFSNQGKALLRATDHLE